MKFVKVLKAKEDELFQIGWSLEFHLDQNDDFIPMYEIADKKAQEDIDKITQWFLKEGYKQFFSGIREEGWDDWGIGGSAWVTQEQLDECNDEGWRMGMGNFPMPQELQSSIHPDLFCSLIPYDFESPITIEGR